MQDLGPAGEWLRLAQYYQRLGDEKLLDLARQPSDLTDMAQQILAQTLATRGLKPPPKAPDASPQRAPRPQWLPDSAAEAESPYADDRELITLTKVFSAADAFKLQHLLDREGIPFYIGPEKATGVDEVTSNFAKGLDVQIMRVGLPWAYRSLQDYYPADIPPEEQYVEPENLSIRCPKCHSLEVVFEHLNPGPTDPQGKPESKFKWTCDSCGHAWEDEGMLKED